MSFINLTKKIDNLSDSKKASLKKKNLFRLSVMVVILSIFVFLPAIVIFFSSRILIKQGKIIVEGYKNQNFNQIKNGISSARFSLSNIDLSLNFLFWLRIMPILGGYYSDIKNFSAAGVEELKALDTIISSLEPSKAELGFNNNPQAGQDRISQIVKILEKSMPLLDKVTPDFKKAAQLVGNIDVEKYPDNFKNLSLKKTLRLIKDSFLGSYIAVTGGKQALINAPAALGTPNPKNYLLLFQNDKEIRATGGFMTAYAELRIDKGQIKTGTSDDIYKLDEQLLKVCLKKICPLTPPAPIAKYLPEFDGKPRKAWSMRDSNLSPDLPTSAKEFETMYRFLGEGFPFDGIIYMDSQVVEGLIEVTGPIDVSGIKYSAEIDSRCNCPNVIYELESYAEIAAKGEKDRKAVLGVLMEQILARSLGSDIQKLPQLLDTLVSLANEKHIMFYVKDANVQKGLSDLNWTGEIKSNDGDYLHINDSNFAGGKSNLYVTQAVTQDITIQKDGTIDKKITIEYSNPQSFSNWLNGINRDYVRVYVPMGSKLISSKGSEDQVVTSEDLGKTVFEAFITVRPQNSRKLEFEYTIPVKMNKDYKILIQKQPGAKDFPYIIKINGKQVTRFNLQMDKELKIPY